jgi:nucleotide-binding universal stress UspA family protein
MKRDRNMFRKTSLAIGWLILAIAGCVSDEAHRYYATERFAPRSEKEVEVLKTAPSRPYDVIADFQARGASVEYMRRRAAEIGADAVIVGTFGGYRAKSDDWASEDKYGDTYSRITGTAIRYRR